MLDSAHNWDLRSLVFASPHLVYPRVGELTYILFHRKKEFGRHLSQWSRWPILYGSFLAHLSKYITIEANFTRMN
jgi:hypothetical protein